MLNSYFFALALWSLPGCWLIARREGERPRPVREPSLAGYIALFCAVRLFLLAMGGRMTLLLGACGAVDAVAFFALAVAERHAASHPCRLLVTGLYLFNPVIPLLAVMEDGMAAISAAVLFLAVYFAVLQLCRRVEIRRLLLPVYLLTGGAYLLAYSREAARSGSGLHLTLLWVVGGICAFFAVVFFLLGLRGARLPGGETVQEGEALHPAWLLRSSETFGRANCVDMLLLTLLGVCVIFLRLGSLRAPQTTMITGQGTATKEIVLSFAEPTEVDRIYAFTGSLESRSVSFFQYNDHTAGRESVKSDAELKAVFAWNSVALGGKFDNLCMVLNDNLAYINEIVVVDGDGQTILPDNAADYPSLFDEQACFPGLVTYYDGTMFDEIYHGRTAFEFLHQLPVYEWTHPPLGKVLIGLGIRWFGMTPFGWRFIPALFGILMIPLTYLFAWRLRRRSRTAIYACALVMTSFMHTTLSRIATLDSIIAFFVLLMFYLMLRYLQDKDDGRRWEARLDLLACGIATGLAVATKWTGCYAAAGIAVMFFAGTAPDYIRRWKQPGTPSAAARLFALCVVSFIAIPAGIYLLSYIPYVRCGGGENVLELAVRNAGDMLSYHEGAVQTHPYQSAWYEWLVDRRPLLDAVTNRADGRRSTVSTFGNPLLLLGGLAAFGWELRAWRLRGDRAGAALCTAYLSMLLPWLLVHRTVFIYQYYPCTIILALMLGDVLAQGVRKRAAVVIGLAAVLFVCYYPVLTGAIAVPQNYVDQLLEWLPTWCFG